MFQEKEVFTSGTCGVNSGGPSSGVQQRSDGGATNAATNGGDIVYAEPSPLAKLLKKLNKNSNSLEETKQK